MERKSMYIPQEGQIENANIRVNIEQDKKLPLIS